MGPYIVIGTEPGIHLVRHGHHPESFRGGWSDHSLSNLGRTQANLLADRLLREGMKVDTLISSDLPRARETAEVLARTLDVPVLLDEDWREVNNGVLAGMPDDRARSLYPGLYWSSLEINQPYPGGESLTTFRRRIEGAFRTLSEKTHRGVVGPNVLVVTHGGSIRVVLSLVNGTEWSNKGPQQPVAETGVFSLTYTGGSWQLARTNDTWHLVGLSVHRLPDPAYGIEVLVRPMISQDVDQFLTWRASDDYLRNVAIKEIQEHLAGKRVLLVAETGG